MTPDYIIPEPVPDSRRPNILLYSSCHVYGMLRYLNEHRPEVREKYNITAVIVHVAANEQGALKNNDFLRAFHEADFILDHPLGSEKWAGFRAEEIGLKSTCHKTAMESPQFSAAWPLHSVGTGELPVRNMLKQGADESDIIRAFDSGRMECQFDSRFSDDCARMREREKTSDLKAALFVEGNFKGTKMFFTPNHPTMPVLAYMMDQFLERLGHARRGPAHALSLPLKTDYGDSYYPETQYEFDHYRLWYPRQYEHSMGGKKFYHSEIARICEA